VEAPVEVAAAMVELEAALEEVVAEPAVAARALVQVPVPAQVLGRVRVPVRVRDLVRQSVPVRVTITARVTARVTPGPVRPMEPGTEVLQPNKIS
jgi:hypothetical protein